MMGTETRVRTIRRKGSRSTNLCMGNREECNRAGAKHKRRISRRGNAGSSCRRRALRVEVDPALPTAGGRFKKALGKNQRVGGKQRNRVQISPYFEIGPEEIASRGGDRRDGGGYQVPLAKKRSRPGWNVQKPLGSPSPQKKRLEGAEKTGESGLEKRWGGRSTNAPFRARHRDKPAK